MAGSDSTMAERPQLARNPHPGRHYHLENGLKLGAWRTKAPDIGKWENAAHQQSGPVQGQSVNENCLVCVAHWIGLYA